jgi:hypothetical protein
VQVLANELQAELMIVMRLVPSQAYGSLYSVLFEARDMARGRSGLSFAFDWKGGTDVPEIRDNMDQVARKFVNDFAIRASTPKRLTVRVFGLEEQGQQAAALRAIRGADGVERVRTRGTAAVPDPFRGGEPASAAEFEVSLHDDADADQIMVQESLGAALTDGMSAVVEPRRTEDGMLAFWVREAIVRTVTQTVPAAPVTTQATPETTTAPSVTPSVTTAHAPTTTVTETPLSEARCASRMMSRSERGEVLREEWMGLYQQQGSPRIAVLINRARTGEEYRLLSESGKADAIGTQIVIAAAGSGGADAGGWTGTLEQRRTWFEQPSRLEYQARALEGQVGRLFNVGRMGATRVIDADTAREGLLKDAGFGERVFDQAELVSTLKSKDIANIVIIGHGQVVEQSSAGRMVKYTFKAVNLADSAQLAVTTVSGYEESFSDEGVTEMATRAVGQLACDMMANWKGSR